MNTNPQSIEAEQAVLGAILFDAEIIDTVIESLNSKLYFSSPRHRLIFDAILKLYNQNTPIDIMVLIDRLSKDGSLEKVGGRVYILELREGIATIANITKYIEIVRENFKLRKIIERCNEVIESAQEHSAESQELIGQIEETLVEISGDKQNEIRTLGYLAGEYTTNLSIKESDEYLETRIADLNRQIVGIFKGDLTIIAGPPSMGKTSFCIDLSLFNTIKNKRTIYFALDETQRAIVQRALTSKTGVDNTRYYAKSFSQHETEMLISATQDMMQKDYIFVYDKPGLTTLDIRSVVRKIKRQHGLDMIIVDYIQQVRGHKKYERRDLEVGDISTRLKEIAKENNIAVVAVSQLNREYAQADINPAKNRFGFPRPSQLRESGTIEQDANMILFPYNVIEAIRKRGHVKEDEIYATETRLNDRHSGERSFIVIAKNKVGQTGVVPCWFNPRRMLFYSEADRQQIDLGEEATVEEEMPF